MLSFAADAGPTSNSTLCATASNTTSNTASNTTM
jgi:hypothetical protein